MSRSLYLPGRHKAVVSPPRSPMHPLLSSKSPCPRLLPSSPPDRWSRQGEGLGKSPRRGWGLGIAMMRNPWLLWGGGP